MESKKNPKADLSKRSLLFLQLGLILVLFISYLGIEWKTYATGNNLKQQLHVEEIDNEIIPITTVMENTPPPIPPPADVIEVIADEIEEEEDEIESTESIPDVIADVSDIKEAAEEEPLGVIPFILIENVPVFPGCENLTTNNERKKCMSEKITQFVNKHFNREIGIQLGLTGINKVYLMFTIDTQGDIVDIQSRAPHPKLEQEAERVINALPKMEPGKQRGKPVSVSYYLPIIFQVHD